MARTTSNLVRAIIDVPADADLDTVIDDASLIVDAVLGASELPTGLLERIETYLAAHGWVMAGNAQLKSEKVGPLAESFAIDTGRFFEGSTYGQQALSLDSSGLLAQHNDRLKKGRGKRKMGVTWLGKDTSNASA